MAVSYKFIDPNLGTTPIGNTDTTPQGPGVGYCAEAKDFSTGDYGIAEFIYVKFTGTVAAGDFVLLDRQAKTCVQSPTSATKGNFGIAMAAQTANTYGWVMLRGVHDAANVATGTAAGSLLTGGGTAGRATTATANYILDGALCKSLAASNTATVEIYYPTCSGR